MDMTLLAQGQRGRSWVVARRGSRDKRLIAVLCAMSCQFYLGHRGALLLM